LHATADEELVGSDEEGIRALALKGGKGRIDLAARSGVEDLDLQAAWYSTITFWPST
jgi:hypothetical protein